jgi:6-phosphogluconolactonase
VARIVVVEAAALADAAAERLTELIEQSIVQRSRAYVSLTGGTTPQATYEALADAARPWRERIDWSRVHLFWGDERCVPPDHPDSNFGMANRALVEHVPIPADHVHRMRGELSDPQQAAVEYAEQLPSTFDVMLLGLGEDCHIASIFPGSPLLVPSPSAAHAAPGKGDTPRPTASTIAPNGQKRITLTPPALLNSRSIVMLVSGRGKAAAVSNAIEGPLDVQRSPCQLLREAGDRVEWFVDREAAARLSAPG